MILVARRFDPSLLSMGEWLAQSGVPVRCISYTPFEVAGRRFLSFSVAFDRSSEPMYPLIFSQKAREPRVYWHNIGGTEDEWWSYLVEKGLVTASFSNEPGDQGEHLLRSYIAGDRIVAYAKGHGAVGWGVVERPESYRLVQRGSADDWRDGHHLHRLDVAWKAICASLSDGVAPGEVRRSFGIYHPVSTSVASRTVRRSA